MQQDHKPHSTTAASAPTRATTFPSSILCFVAALLSGELLSPVALAFAAVAVDFAFDAALLLLLAIALADELCPADVNEFMGETITELVTEGFIIGLLLYGANAAVVLLSASPFLTTLITSPFDNVRSLPEEYVLPSIIARPVEPGTFVAVIVVALSVMTANVGSLVAEAARARTAVAASDVEYIANRTIVARWGGFCSIWVKGRSSRNLGPARY